MKEWKSDPSLFEKKEMLSGVESDERRRRKIGLRRLGKKIG